VYLLDTDVCVWLIRGRESVVSAIRAHSPGDLAIGSMTEAELWYGARKGGLEASLASTKRFIEEISPVVPFDSAAAKIHAQVRLALKSTPISDRDLVIASTALAHGLTVVTGNVREFSRVPGLQVESWM